MNVQERSVARILFKNKIHEANGQAFEDIFTQTMYYAHEGFQSIKPWGNIGDRKNDGYIKSEGTYYQVYAPEDITKSYVDFVKKIETDFIGLVEQWSPVNNFYFVVNDKYRGVNADCEQLIQGLKDTYKLKDAKILTAKDLENEVFSLEDDQIFRIVGFLPDPSNLKNMDFSILNEVISHIMGLPIDLKKEPSLVVPDFNEKIKFNDLSEVTAEYLNSAFVRVVYLNDYLSNNSDFIADLLRDKLNEVYLQEKEKYSGDELFWNIVNQLSPKKQQVYQVTVIVIMSKYFETCDIFEEPFKEGEE
ncbi:hypothetical protein HYG86_00235 [Alkalicella caledoniensis]|uniref:ABC-three component systems C-terminal domain-containing protein n=1 Tax=Alkalicella caledoniensis TaxID=2731377 RepID=A0A7G9W3Q3_ALKCA|nr:ABC-three component system protein [Alkalicella caledoniensis]QNO13315.1 hypothetical protein HYG86_00235 [Alkalicella caledoniensis]